VITFGLAELSYRWIETPIRHQGFRSSFRSWQADFKQWSILQKVGVGAGIFSVGLLLVWQSFVPLPETSLVNIPVLQSTSISIDNVSNSATPATSRNTSLAPSTSIPAHPTRASQNPGQTFLSTPIVVTEEGNFPRVTFIGDSIMQGTIPMMEDVLGQGIYIDAARKRRMEDVPALIEILAEEEHLSETVVIHLGSNRPFEAPIFDQVMELLLAHQVKRIIFINVHRPIGWEYHINKQFSEGIARWPQAELIDWEALAHSRQEWFIKDQTHLSYKGSQAYVTAIQEKLEKTP
jgi:hypothetical protein